MDLRWGMIPPPAPKLRFWALLFFRALYLGAFYFFRAFYFGTFHFLRTLCCFGALYFFGTLHFFDTRMTLRFLDASMVAFMTFRFFGLYLF